MSYAFVQKATAFDGTGQTSHTLNLTGVTVGDLLVLVVCSNKSGAPSSVTEGSDTVTVAIPWGGNSGGAVFGGVWYAVAGSTTASLSVTLPVSGELTLQIYEYSGNASANVLDTNAGMLNGSSTSPSSGAATPAGTGELAFSLLVTTAASPTWAGGYAARESFAATNYHMLTADQVLSSASAVTASATIVTAPWGIGQAFFKPPQPAVTVSSSHTASIAGSSGTYTLTEAVASNDVIVVQWALNNVSGADIPTITDTVNGPYSILGSSTYYAAGTKAWGVSWIACRSAGAAPVITVTDAGMNNAQLLITHLTGFTAIPAVDAIASNSGTGTSITNSANINYASEFVLSNTFSSAGAFSGTPSGWTSTASGGNGSILQNYYESNPSIGAVNLSGTLTSSGTFLNTIVSFNSTPAPTTVPLGGPKRVQWHWR